MKPFSIGALLFALMFISVGISAGSVNADAAEVSFLNTRSAAVEITLNSSFVTDAPGREVLATLAFFPKLLRTQEVEGARVKANTQMLSELKNQQELLLRWPAPPKETQYSVTHTVSTFSVRPDLTREPYPLLELPYEFTPFLTPTRSITSDDKEIRELAKRLVQDTDETFKAAYNIASWVRDHIAYNLSTLTADVSQNASWVLTTRTGVCDELTVLFLALTRAAEIPSRYVAGVVYTDSDLFGANWIPHAWAEVYLPSIGWVPFDLTYGQFGWVDASHIIAKTSGEVEDPSITYQWKQGDITLGPLELDGNIIAQQAINVTPLSISLQPLVNRVYPGSRIPVKITVRNPTEFRLPATLFVSKAPGLIGSPTIPLFLEPNSAEEYFIFIAVPDRVDAVYDYSAPVVVADSYGATATTSLEFGTAFAQVPRYQAEAMVERYVKSKQASSGDLRIHCSLSKPFYRKGEEGALVCSVQSYLREETESLICFKESCKTQSLKPQNTDTASFTFIANEDEEINVSVTTPQGKSVYFHAIEVANQETMSITKVACPTTLTSTEEGRISLLLSSEEPVEDVFVLVEGMEPAQAADFAGEQQVIVPVVGKTFLNNQGVALVYVTYSDTHGARYETFATCPLVVDEASFFDIIKAWWNGLKQTLKA